jgi:replication factor C subunit 1
VDDRSAPPNKGDKEAPRGPANCLEGVTIVISGVLDSLERPDAEAGDG